MQMFTLYFFLCRCSSHSKVLRSIMLTWAINGTKTFSTDLVLISILSPPSIAIFLVSDDIVLQGTITTYVCVNCRELKTTMEFGSSRGWIGTLYYVLLPCLFKNNLWSSSCTKMFCNCQKLSSSRKNGNEHIIMISSCLQDPQASTFFCNSLHYHTYIDIFNSCLCLVHYTL